MYRTDRTVSKLSREELKRKLGGFEIDLIFDLTGKATGDLIRPSTVCEILPMSPIVRLSKRSIGTIEIMRGC